jgi:hypothetical protein
VAGPGLGGLGKIWVCSGAPFAGFLAVMSHGAAVACCALFSVTLPLLIAISARLRPAMTQKFIGLMGLIAPRCSNGSLLEHMLDP